MRTGSKGKNSGQNGVSATTLLYFYIWSRSERLLGTAELCRGKKKRMMGAAVYS